MKRIFLFIIICISYVTVYAENRNEGQVPFYLEESESKVSLPQLTAIPEFVPMYVYVNRASDGQPIAGCAVTFEIRHYIGGILQSTWTHSTHYTDVLGQAVCFCAKPLIGYYIPTIYLYDLKAEYTFICNQNPNDWRFTVIVHD